MTEQPQFRITPVDGHNLWPVLKLKVAPEQTQFIETNAQSLAEAGFDKRFDWHPYALMVADTVVGFAMIGALNTEERYIWLDRLMLDAQYQHHGWGGTFLELLKAFIMTNWPVDTIVLSYERENTEAERFYFHHGFRDLHRVDDNNGEKMAVFGK
ncbi:GNAT family N-acetyltransferase [Schleiferilactobacillus harbinensis]|jgi:diamine N-acetyltransferase|uniref:GNAT family N-acetyltransferase n=1 Tax=Schleiferilactobacillus harbinensis TaxID=304207 RepID=UPI0021A74BEC|nr:GNAT family N-acetyltransferase [Schleiferilactobacillus harbinensis]MCI1687111.1 GNAT family N-acetyltransferase [Schleiferilactobacillus harbinensis]MCI1784304.1 GNAT family N-acetyltransferase [Schleiferilactobacillus harbinensis]MCI1850018.1 GNAT family N-acetyltransferase [Schleiferilactobacillus harbinensis]